MSASVREGHQPTGLGALIADCFSPCTDGILGFSAYTLAFTLPRLRDPVKQRLGVYVWTGISVVMLGVLMNLFKIKQGACK